MPFRNYISHTYKAKSEKASLLRENKNATLKSFSSDPYLPGGPQRSFSKVSPHYNSHSKLTNENAQMKDVNDLIGQGSINALYFPKDQRFDETRRSSNSSNGSNDSGYQLLLKKSSPKTARKSSMFSNKTFPLRKSPKEICKGGIERVQSNEERKLMISNPVAKDLDRLPSELVDVKNQSSDLMTVEKPSFLPVNGVGCDDDVTNSLATVRLRKKLPNSPKAPRNHRRGFLLRTPSEEKQNITHDFKSSSQSKRNSIDQSKRNSVSRQPSNKVSERISRTIKALYDGEEDIPQEEPAKEVVVDEKPPKSNHKPLLPKLSTKLSIPNGSNSPKTDKQTRKRSPKPARRNNNNVLLKDVDGSRRFKWRGSVNKIVKKFGTGQPFMPGGTFGVHLEDCPQSLINEFVPFVVDLCCRLVETHGLFFTGIYRVPGNNASLTLLKDDLNLQGSDAYQGDSDERFRDVNVVSSLLKLFFRKLPDPLFTNELYSDFIQMNRNPEPELRLKGLRQLVHMLPAPHYETLKFLTLHLRKIADHSHENKMEVRNLAIVFGPTLVRSTADDNMTTMVKDMSDQCRIVESVIQHADWFFKEEAESDSSENILSPPLIPEQPTAHEPVPSIRYLLANVGRTPGDNNTSDNTSESSKSKNSIESEKDSFSKEVFEKLFGRKVKKEKHDDGVDSADEHGGFENRVTSQKSIETEQHSTPNFTLSEEPITNKSQETTHKPLYNEKDDISARLYEFYIEHLDKMAKTTIIPQFSSTESSPQVTPRLSKQFVYSIPDVAMVEKRHVRQKSDGNPYDYNHPFIANGSQHNVHGNQFKSTETLHRSNQTLNVNNNQSYAGAPLNQSTPVRDPPTYKPPPTVTEHRRGSATNPTIRNYNSNLSTYSHDLPLPSKTIRPNDSLETKLKYLTNLDGKHDTSVMLKDQQLYNEKLVDEPVPEQKPRQIQHRKNSHSTNHKISSASRIVAAMTSPILGRREHLKRSNPSITAAGELLDKHEPKKSAQKLYNERKIQREKIKQQKQAVKAEKKRALVRNENSAHAQLNIPIPNSVTISLTSPIDDSGSVTPEADRNVPAFNRKDPKRRVIARTHDENSHISHNRTQSDQNIPPSPKSPATSDKKQRSFRKKINKVVRRHTLGAGDFPDHTFWEENENENLPNKRLSLTDSADVIPPSHSSTSLCDLTSEKNNAYNQQLSAVDRLLPKVPTTHSTIRSWMLQERMKNRSGIFTKSQHEILVRPKSQKS